MKATKERIELNLKGLKSEKADIEAKIQVASSHTLLRELREVDTRLPSAILSSLTRSR
jgi:hypothetical protein